MTTYLYKCDNCNPSIEFEIEQRMSDPIKATCPLCGKDTEHRLISRTSFILKGSCWTRDSYSSQLRHEIANLPEEPEGDD